MLAAADSKPSLNISATGDIRTLNGAIRIENQQLRMNMGANGVGFEAVQGPLLGSPFCGKKLSYPQTLVRLAEAS